MLNDSFGYVDTLDIARSLDRPCSKLQCLVNGLRRDDLRPHRAVDDCFALREVCRCMADALGLEPLQLLSRFAFECDVPATVSNLSVMTAVSENIFSALSFHGSYRCVTVNTLASFWLNSSQGRQLREKLVAWFSSREDNSWLSSSQGRTILGSFPHG